MLPKTKILQLVLSCSLSFLFLFLFADSSYACTRYGTGGLPGTAQPLTCGAVTCGGSPVDGVWQGLVTYKLDEFDPGCTQTEFFNQFGQPGCPIGSMIFNYQCTPECFSQNDCPGTPVCAKPDKSGDQLCSGDFGDISTGGWCVSTSCYNAQCAYDSKGQTGACLNSSCDPTLPGGTCSSFASPCLILNPCVAHPTITNLSASPSSIPNNSSSSLSYAVSNPNGISTQCLLTGQNVNEQEFFQTSSFSQSGIPTGNLSGPASYTYNLTCSNDGGVDEASVIITVAKPGKPSSPPSPPGSCSLSTTNVTSTTATVQVTDGVTGFNKTNWYFGTTNPPPWIPPSRTETSWTFDLLTPNTKYYVKAERWNDPNHIPSDATCQGNTGTGSSSVESFTTTGPTPPPGGGGGGGGETHCWWWPQCCNTSDCLSGGATKFIEGTTTSGCGTPNKSQDAKSATGCSNGVYSWNCGTCAAPPPPGGSSCTTGWSGVGSFRVSCGTPVPGGFMAKQIRIRFGSGGGEDGIITWKSQGSTGGNYSTTDGSNYDLGGGAVAEAFTDGPQTVYWGTDKLISGGVYRVGCNDGENIGVDVERCNPTCDNTAPSAPTLSSPGNGSSIVSSPVTLTFSHNGNYGTACAGGNNRLKVYAGVGSPSSVVCDLPPGSTSCQTTVSDGQNYQWKVQATNGSLSSDSATWAFSVLFNSGGWFQVQDSDVTSPGDLISRIPLRCTGNCIPQFGLSGGGGYPGVPAYGGANADFGGGSVSLKEWLANTKYSGRRYDYAWFAKLAPSGVFTNEESVITDSQISGGDLVSGFASGGYFWRYKNGDLTVNGTANMGDRKVVLFVNGNLTLNGRITVNDGKGFFAAIASGNINIDPTVSHPNDPALEGIFMSNGTISTGSKSPNPDDRLYIRGALVGWGGISLQRDLDPNKTSGANNLTAAEYVEYAPDLILTFPRELLREGIVWKEVAP